MQIRIIIGDATLHATLADNATARDFAALLPLNLTLRDHAATEKVGDLPRKLSGAGAPGGAKGEVGDIAYYAPWGNLAIFHKNFPYSRGLIQIGRIDAGVGSLAVPGNMSVRIEADRR